ncbi:MAG: hypothetical protein IAF02_15775 [Anaerolineae bacterium]|nr:hypothetical protein [Anaerolineae bacterium]
MSPILYAIAISSTALLFLALNAWDKSQEGKGFQGIVKILRRLGKALLFFCGFVVVFVGTSTFSISGFWAGIFSLLLFPSTGTICLPLSAFGFFIVVLLILNSRSR